MRLSWLLVISLAACGARSSGPAWPKQAEPEKDGGESIAPRAGTPKAIEAAPDDDAKDKPLVAAETKPEATPAEPADTKDSPPTPADAAPPDDVLITTEEIVIEIDDDE